MKKLIVLAAAICLMYQMAPASWQTGTEARLGITVSPEGMIPTGDFHNTNNVGVGGVVTADYRLMPSVALTATTGYLWFHGDKNTVNGITFKNNNINAVPVVGGLRYYALPNLYVGGELGIHRFMNIPVRNALGVIIGDKSKNQFSASPMVGFEQNYGNWGVDVNAGYTWTSDFHYVGARLGLKFGM